MARQAQYAAALAAAGADALVLTSEAAVQHAAGVHLFTQRLIPERPVVCVITHDQEPVVIACVLEQDQLAAEHPGLELRTFREFGDDPWALVADALPGSGTIIAEDSIPAGWLAHLRRQLTNHTTVTTSYDEPLGPRIIKDEQERTILANASRAAELALADGARFAVPGRSERDIARRIAETFAAIVPDASEVEGACIAPQHNRAMHHVSGGELLPDHGPVRLGVVARAAGYWVLITRMLALGDDPQFMEAYGRYLRVYEQGMQALQVGACPADIHARCRELAATQGFELTTLKVGHGTGLDFRERPWLSPIGEMPLAEGMILAYDYGLETHDGTVLHLEDRIQITADGPIRLSDGWQLPDLQAGFEALRAD